jgi:branched-chain amino acid transport system ATP-binding protein
MRLTATDVIVIFDANPVLFRLSLVVEPGVLVVVKGKNGAGKTTLLDVLSGLVRPSDGEIWLDNQSVAKLEPQVIARAGLTRVRQHPWLIQSASVVDNVVFGSAPSPREHPLTYLLRPRSCRRAERNARDEAYNLLEQLAIAHRGSTVASSLSFGEVKLVALARAVLTGAKIFLLDEVLSGLGSHERVLAMRLIRSVATSGRGVLCVEHEGAGWESTDARVMFLEGGRLCERKHV